MQRSNPAIVAEETRVLAAIASDVVMCRPSLSRMRRLGHIVAIGGV